MAELPNIPSAASPSLLVDRREAGRLLNVSPGTTDNLRNRGELPSLKIGARRLYAVADLFAFIDARKAAWVTPNHTPGTGGGAP